MRRFLFVFIVFFSFMHASLYAKDVSLEAKVTGLYVAFFNRAADEEGLNYWTQKGEEAEQNGEDVSDVLKELSFGFAQHPSFERAYGELDNEAFVEAIYVNTLGRAGDTEGVGYWKDLLDNGMSRSDFVSVFVESALTFDPDDSQYADLSQEELDAAQLRQDLLANKVEVALAFTHQLGSLTNVTDSDNPEEDPAYLASIRIIADVTDDSASMADVLDFLNSIEGSTDPIAAILEWHDSVDEDTIAPAITLNGDSSVTLTRGSIYSEAGATATDDVDGSVAVTVSGSVDTMSVGEYTLSYSATDSAGNTATLTRNVTVIHDTIPPVITLNGASEITLSTGESYSEEGATATDNVDGTLLVSISGSVDTSTEGTYTLTYRATDLDGNEAVKTRTVLVETLPDTTPPAITLNGDSSVTLTRGSSYSEAGATATDDVDGSVAVTVSGSVDTMSVGEYTLSYSATDSAGNTATLTRNVTVIHDTIPPVITLNGASEITLSTGESYSEEGATATDNVDGTLLVSISGSVDTSTEGTYTLTYRATDLDGNEATVIRTVIVETIVYEEVEGLNYLNAIRAQMSLRPFVFSTELNIAAKAHSDYLDANDILSHYEDSDNTLFYAEWPVDRAVKAQYAARYVSENAAAGQMDVESAIDGLFTAIYHRLAFMDPQWDEIGIGVTWTKYVFDMGNSGIRSLCQESQEERDEATDGESTYRTICLDTDKWITVDEYDAAVNLSPEQSYFVYPPVDATDILPVFTNETPDPLPYKSYSGNPVSISFNSSVVACDELSKKSFTLVDDNLSASVDIYVDMDEENDPNSIFTTCDFAIFPTERLEFDHHYTASFAYSDGSGDHTISWGYSTENPGTVLKAVESDESFDIVSGKTYYIYIPPTDDDPSIGSVQWSYPSSMDIETFLFYDSNTLKVQVSGDAGDTLSITYQDDKKVSLTIE